jgi:hypothetical protein
MKRIKTSVPGVASERLIKTLMEHNTQHTTRSTQHAAHSTQQTTPRHKTDGSGPKQKYHTQKHTTPATRRMRVASKGHSAVLSSDCGAIDGGEVCDGQKNHFQSHAQTEHL